MSEQEIEEKQNYLRNEILDKGFNGEDFMNFLISKKGEDGSDINNWTMDELRMVASEFQNQFSSNQPIQQEEPYQNENQYENQYSPQPQVEASNDQPISPPKVEERKQAPRKKCTMFGGDYNPQKPVNNQAPTPTPVVQPRIEPKPKVEQKITSQPTVVRKPQSQEPQIEEIQCKGPERSKLSSFDDLKITLSL